MLDTVAKVRHYLDQELRLLQQQVFVQPPSDWAGFMRMLGEAQRIMQLQEATKPRPIDEDDEK